MILVEVFELIIDKNGALHFLRDLVRAKQSNMLIRTRQGDNNKQNDNAKANLTRIEQFITRELD